MAEGTYLFLAESDYMQNLDQSCSVPTIPLLIPKEDYRIRRWKRVLEWYGLRERKSPDSQRIASEHVDRCSPTQVQGPRLPESGLTPAGECSDWVVYAEDSLALIGIYLSRNLGRPLKRLESIVQLPEWIDEENPSSCLVLAKSSLLGYRFLMKTCEAGKSNCCHVGFIPGIDEPGISFLAAKTVASRHCETRSWAAVDAIFDTIVTGMDGEKEFCDENVRSILSDNWSQLLISAHGEGAHLLLNKSVVCGLFDTCERDLRGRTIAGCKHMSECKRAGNGSRAIFRSSDLRTRVLAILSCNSISLCGEIYPSNLSLAIGALEGYAATVIGTPATGTYGPDHPVLLRGLVASGRSLGEILRLLGQIRLGPGSRVTPYLVLGDPLFNENQVVPTRHSIASPPSNQISSLRLVTLPGDGPTRLCFSDYGSGKLYVTDSNALVLIDPAVDEPLLEDMKTVHIELRALYDKWGNRERFAADLEHGLVKLCQTDKEVDTQFENVIVDLTEQRQLVSYFLMGGIRILKAIEERGVWDSAVTWYSRRILMAASKWDSLFAKITENYLLSGGIVGDRLLGLVHAFYRVRRQESGKECPVCAGPTEDLLFSHFLPGRSERIATECALCGPLVENSANGLCVAIGLQTPLKRGESSTLDLAFSSELEGPSMLICEVRDKTKEDAVRFHQSVPAGTTRMSLDLVISEKAGFDQHSVRVVLVGSMDMAYCRRVFTLSPQ